MATAAAAHTTTALYLAHLNPVTNAHVEIISDLRDNSDSVKVMPVVFRNNGAEVNSRSFPFSFEARKDMLESVFGDSITITSDYTFHTPFKRYMPPLLSPMSWKLRKQILRGVDGKYFSYTGDRAEGYMLRLYRLKPRVGKRKPVSAASVKERMYEAAMRDAKDAVAGGAPADSSTADAPSPLLHSSLWVSDVPDSVARIIASQWDVVKRFAGAEDMTARIAGMKFPKQA